MLSGSFTAQAIEPDGPQWTTPEQLGQPRFEVQLVQRLSDNPDQSRIDVFVEVVNDFLQFVRYDSTTFQASVDISLSIESAGKGEIQRQTITLQKKTSKYEETNSHRDFLTGNFTIEQSSGDYSIVIILVDRESNRREKAEKKITLSSKSSDRLALSELMLMKTNEIMPGSRMPIQPIPSDIIEGQIAEVFVLFDINRPNTLIPCQANLIITDSDNIVVAQDSLALIGGTSMATYTMPISASGLKFGRYKATLTCSQDGSSIVSEKFFDVNSSGLPRTIRDLDESIEQLKYIASEAEMEALRNQFVSDREQAFINFWNKIYPVEAQKVNGKMVEYYNRISYANENYSGSTPGWESDRGRVLALYGKPSEVERNLFEQDGTPYEIWYYNHIGKRFTFRDDYGFGDYRLVTPVW